MPIAGSAWHDYVTRFHRERPAITEALLAHTRRGDVGSPYDWLVRGVTHAENATWVDLGCGSAPIHPRQRAARYVGVDVSAAELAVAASVGRSALVRATATGLPLAAETADVVSAAMSLMLLDPTARAMAEIARVAKPGAVLAVIVPTGWPVAVRDARGLLTMTTALRDIPSAGGVVELRLPRLMRAAGFDVLDNRALRFSYRLADEHDVRLLIESLHLPNVSTRRMDAAVTALARRAGPGADFPVPIRRLLARRR